MVNVVLLVAHIKKIYQIDTLFNNVLETLSVHWIENYISIIRRKKTYRNTCNAYDVRSSEKLINKKVSTSTTKPYTVFYGVSFYITLQR